MTDRTDIKIKPLTIEGLASEITSVSMNGPGCTTDAGAELRRRTAAAVITTISEGLNKDSLADETQYLAGHFAAMLVGRLHTGDMLEATAEASDLCCGEELYPYNLNRLNNIASAPVKELSEFNEVRTESPRATAALIALRDAIIAGEKPASEDVNDAFLWCSTPYATAFCDASCDDEPLPPEAALFVVRYAAHRGV